jgi:hypothetical protein
MINAETFEEMLSQERLSRDCILKTIQADVILTKSEPLDSDLEHGNYIKRLVLENQHNGLKKEHYDNAVDLYEYQGIKALKSLFGQDQKFPLLNTGVFAQDSATVEGEL